MFIAFAFDSVLAPQEQHVHRSLLILFLLRRSNMFIAFCFDSVLAPEEQHVYSSPKNHSSLR